MIKTAHGASVEGRRRNGKTIAPCQAQARGKRDALLFAHYCPRALRHCRRNIPHFEKRQIGRCGSRCDAAVLATALDGDCSVHSVAELILRDVARGDLRALNNTVGGLPERLHCPIILRGAVGYCGASELVEQWSWSRIRKAGPQPKVTYDSSVDLAAFTYWDNNTLLASSVNSIGRRPQGFTVTTASARKLVDVATPPGKASRYARFARKLHQYSSSMAEELASAGMDSSSQQQPRSVTGPFAPIAPSPAAGQARTQASSTIRKMAVLIPSLSAK